MEREYQRPEVELVSLVTEEITNEGILDGSTGLESSEGMGW